MFYSIREPLNILYMFLNQSLFPSSSILWEYLFQLSSFYFVIYDAHSLLILITFDLVCRVPSYINQSSISSSLIHLDSVLRQSYLFKSHYCPLVYETKKFDDPKLIESLRDLKSETLQKYLPT